ncbi:alpha-2-macroglobulin, partial [Parabacteroides sp. OttesenSCG-928-J18]|nr:alpha-2-macroglobulin [Parabacteroides sp. OttesenSCG-928-J18]
MKKITVTIYKSQTKAIELTGYRSDKDSQKGEVYKKISFDLDASNPYSVKSTMLQIELPETGIYDLSFSAEKEHVTVSHTVSVTHLAAVTRRSEAGGQEVLVLDLQSGKPLQGVSVTYYGDKRRDLKEMGVVKTDKEGVAIIPKNDKIYAFQATSGKDTSSRFTMLYPEYGADRSEPSTTNLSLFTDRGIYRPGQNVFYKGIAWQLNKEQATIVANKEYKVTLRDANDKEVSQQKVRTNAFGSFHGEFTLPKQALAGAFTLLVEGVGSTWFRVEEYKRPTFRVEVEPIKEEVAFGDEVTLRGKAETFSGVALQEGEVTWRIVRHPFWLYRDGFREEQVAQGVTTVGVDGGFSVAFRPEKTESSTNFWRQFYRFELIATVTDSKGETQETAYSFPVGEASMTLSVGLADKVDKKKANAQVTAQLLNGEPAVAKGTFRIVALTEEKEETNKPTTFKEGITAASGNFQSGEAIDPSLFAAMASGRYRIRLEAKDSKGRMVETEQDFVLYAIDDKRPPIVTNNWLIETKTVCQPGETAEWTFGTSREAAYVLYEVFQNNKRIQKERLVLNNENRTFKLPFRESYGDGVMVSLTYLKEGELFVTQIPIKRALPDRKLTIRPETFRDRLLPGSQETWKFRITDSDSLAVSAEVLAGMYDSSLDQIVPFAWYFAPERNIYLQAPRFALGTGFNYSYQNNSAKADHMKVDSWQFDRIDWQGIMNMGYGAGERIVVGRGLQMKSSMVGKEMEEAGDMLYAVSDNAATKEDQAAPESATGGGESKSEALPQLRTNFNETAFFFPSLLTNEAGDLIVSFTIPESNTSWKLQAIAHTKDLKYGQMTENVITSKPFMVLPSLPRFLREGDKITISTQLLSQTEEALQGKVRLEWFDPATNQPINGMNTAEQSFRLAAKGQAKAHWTVEVPSGMDLIGVRIMADADAGSDGEQHILPILPGRILVTESQPFYLKENDPQQVKLNQPKGSSPFRMTLEVSGNPVWYAVQALSTLQAPQNDDILSWFAVYYTNTLATSIAQAHPRIQQVIAQWTAQGGNVETLLSNLEKNEELKNILLEETPWVLEAEDESERKQRLALLFDTNRANDLRQLAMQQLLDQQMEDGGWGWFKGFMPNRQMTLSILKGMSALTQMGSVQYNEEEKRMQISALRYLDKSITKSYEWLKKQDTEWEKAIPTSDIIEFLYVRSSYRDIPEDGSAREAIRFYTNQAEKNWEKLSLYEKGQVALLMHRNGKKEVAQTILAWLRKTATVSESQGMYWANNRRGSSFFTSPIDIHSLLMLAFHEIDANKVETDNMKQWLLNEKRTQNWESTPATLNAIHAILLTGSDWLSTNNKVMVQWGTKNYSTSDGEIATGYLKETLTGAELTGLSDVLTVRKEGGSPAWGAVYSQYFASVDQVKGQKGVLNVEKKLFVETNNGKERQIRPVDNHQLRVGDRVIVRLTIRTDREMNYVYLKDLRAGCFEPAAQLSGSRSRDGVWFYQSPKDVSENLFFERLPKGTFVVEYPVYVARTGNYAAGITTIQCLYAPEFVSHTEGSRLDVKD